ncbi:MAG TPA: carboxymuconolactone decarboxylase family protein [Azospirillaceae bacterium]|nr:carboxymuconolactone decarboxylase family protein [Azospirillaceae bacterium]
MPTITMLDKELVAVAISVAAGCRPCTTYHLAEARRAGADDAAIEKAVAGAMCVRKSATEGMRLHALGLEAAEDGCGCGTTDALAELVALGASLAVNCTANIDKHLTAARRLDVPPEHLDAVAALAGKIRSQAIRHAEEPFGGGPARSPMASCAEVMTSAKCC